MFGFRREPPYDCTRHDPLDRKRHRCDVCGAPAEWRTRIFGQFENQGEALCDVCEVKHTMQMIGSFSPKEDAT